MLISGWQTLLLLGCLVVQSSAAKNSRRKAIVGGSDAAPNRYPYFALLEIEVNYQDGKGYVYCGGTLVHPDIVLTAANCNIDFETGTVAVNATTFVEELRNEHTEHHRKIVDRVEHPDFELVKEENDLMLVKLETPVTAVDPIKLNDDEDRPFSDDTATVIGLGLDSEVGGSDPAHLQTTTVEIVATSHCNQEGWYSGEINGDLILCAGSEDGSRDSCTGDGGGPLLTTRNSRPSDDVQIGITSAGFGCGRPNFPGKYTRVSTYKSWIEDEICKLSSVKPSSCPGEIVFGICYSADMQVTTKKKGSIAMSVLQVGDEVLVSAENGKHSYDKVYSFGHLDRSQKAKFVQIFTDHDSMLPLELSADHMVFLWTATNQKQAVPASLVKLGDRLVLASGGSGIVSKIESIRKTGVYAPFTYSGALVVNGIVSSSYVAVDESPFLKIGSIETPFTWQWLAHRFESTHRMASRVLPQETEPNGISAWVKLPFQMLEWTKEQHPGIVLLLLAPVILLLIMMNVLETVMFDYPTMLALAVMGCLIVTKRHKSIN